MHFRFELAFLTLQATPGCNLKGQPQFFLHLINWRERIGIDPTSNNADSELTNRPELQDAENAAHTQHRQHATSAANAQNAAGTANAQNTPHAADAENTAGAANAENTARAAQA